MEEHCISAFIDDQLELDEKIQFVKAIHEDRGFKDETLSYLVYEKKLRAPVIDQLPDPLKKLTLNPQKRPVPWIWFRQFAFYAGGLVTALLLAFLILTSKPDAARTVAYRFVIYQPDIQTAALVGSFSDWKTVAMKHRGAWGYWEVTVELPPGEYRYSFVLDSGRRVADPTSPAQERDDFGGINSILSI
jgi:hypothetical protein